MRRLIVARSTLEWSWNLSHFPHPKDHLQVEKMTQVLRFPLLENVPEIPEIETIEHRMQTATVPDLVTLITPGEGSAVRFGLTRESTVPYTISESCSLLITDAPVIPPETTLTVQCGWCVEDVPGVRLVTPELARRKVGQKPEAFGAGAILGASARTPVLYLLGGTAAVLLTSEERGVYCSRPEYAQIETAAHLIGAEFLQILQATNDPTKTVEQWLDKV